MTDNPFRPAPQPTAAELAAYAEGRLAPEARHRVQRALEEDPLLRDALEGLLLPGTFAALQQLERHHPLRRGGRLWPGLGLLVLAGGVAWWALHMQEQAPLPEPEHSALNTFLAQPDAPATPQVEAVLAEEVTHAEELPTTQQLGHHTREAPAPDTVPREPLPERLDPRAADPRTVLVNDRPAPLRTTRDGRRLIFLHDLKLVHPEELYPDQLLSPAPGGTTADRGEPPAEIGPAARRMAYLRYMDVALGRFVRNDHRQALLDLSLVLDQYPDDVNALFYGGLCAYNLGLFARAQSLLDRAATHAVRTFQEEAAWYAALSQEQAGDRAAAHERLRAIAEADGFYATRARQRLGGE